MLFISALSVLKRFFNYSFGFNEYKSFYRTRIKQILHLFYRWPWRLPGIHRGP